MTYAAPTIDLDEARRALGLKSMTDFGRALGYNDGPHLRQQIRERKNRQIGPKI